MNDTSPRSIGTRITENLLGRQDYMRYDVGDVHSIHYAEACAGCGALRFAKIANDTALLAKVIQRYREAREKNIPNTANHVDANVWGIIPLEIYLLTGDPAELDCGVEFADLQWRDPLPDGMTNQTRYWIDDIYMITRLQGAAFDATGKSIYLERAALEVEAYLVKLQQPNGLFHHGSDAKFFWGRGNGWVAAGLAELLCRLPETHRFFNSIHRGYVMMMNALRRYQCPDGMWRQLIDVEEAWKETSASAMFAYAAAAGVRKGLLPEAGFSEVYARAWNSLSDYVHPDGSLSEICTGTGQSADMQFYLDRPRVTGDLHGQAAMLWLAGILLEMGA